MPIKVFRSDQLGAPLINGVPGTLVAALDAILVNGYGQVGVSSIARVGATATVMTAAAHGLATGDTCLIAGASQQAYNGEHVVTVTGATSYTIAVAGEPVTPASGSIISKRAPGGFTKAFAATNKAVYRAIDNASRKHYFRVVDSGLTPGGGREATLHGFEQMTDVDTGTGMYPSAGQYQSGYFWQKSDTTDSSGRGWVIITDGKTVYGFAYIQSRTDGTTSYASLDLPGINMGAVAFGDLLEQKVGDAYASFVTGSSQSNNFSSSQYSGLFCQATSITNSLPSVTTPLFSMARDYTAVPGSRIAQIYASGLSNANFGSAPYIAYPHLLDNGFYMVPAMIVQGVPSVIRGRVPGMFEPMHGPCLPNTTILDNVQGFPGRKFMMLYGKASSAIGSCVIDITGPWDN